MGTIFSTNIIGMRGQVIALVTLMLLFVLVVATHKRKEAFTGSSVTGGEIACPLTAERTTDGKIKVQPGNKIFGTMQEYTTYLAGIYAQGSTCIPPMVRKHNEPVDLMLGGLGVGAPSPSDVARQGASREVLDTDFHGEQTSAKTPIQKLDDYEYSRVYQSEHQKRNTDSVGAINRSLEARTLDWANLPFNSETQAAGSNEFMAGVQREGMVEPKTGLFFKNAEGASLLPPDVEAEKAREAKVLAAYRPTSISKHVIDSKTEQVAKLVNDMYASDPNWTPVIEKVDENNYKVVELIPKPRKEMYEEEQTKSLSMAEADGHMVPPPSITIDDRIRGDPYFDKNGVGDRDNDKVWNYKDFKKWTPGLERMFAPTNDMREWS